MGNRFYVNLPAPPPNWAKSNETGHQPHHLYNRTFSPPHIYLNVISLLSKKLYLSILSLFYMTKRVQKLPVFGVLLSPSSIYPLVLAKGGGAYG